MRSLRAVLGRLDPWAALLLGVLVTLGVVILLATPGPWRKVVGFSPQGGLASSPPTDVAVFVLGAGNGDCTGVVWLHVDHKRRSLTASVLAPQTQGYVPGGGYVPLDRIVDDLGAYAAAAALSTVLGVEMDTWASLDRDGLRLAVAPMVSGGQGRPRLRLYAAAGRAWEGRGVGDPWPEQYETLRLSLPQVELKDLNVVAFANYVLGFGIVRNELDLQAATSLAKTLKTVRPSQVRVRACPAVVDTCRGAEAWDLDPIALRSLRHSLEVGLRPPPSEPVAVARRREARVLIVVPQGALAVDAYVDEVRQSLGRSSGAPVAVRVVRAAPARLATAVRAVLNEWRPLAVLVAPPRADAQTEGQASALQELGVLMSRRDQPAVMSLPWRAPAEQAGGRGGVETGRLAAVIESIGLPVSRISGGGTAQTDGGASRLESSREVARANVETLVRACWPGVLAPRLASTRLGFSFAAGREVSVGVIAPSRGSAERAMDRLRLWGYEPTALSSSEWQPVLDEGALYYREGMRRPALALGGDLGMRRNSFVAADSAPADLTLVLDE